MKTPWLGDIKAEFVKNNRLRLGALVIAVLLFADAVSVLSTWRQQWSRDYEQLQTRLVRVQHISKEGGWPKRAADAEAIRKALEAEIPTADSVGLAQATFQGWLRQVVGSTGLPLSLSMGTPSPVDGMPGYFRIPATLAGRIDSRRALEVLRLIESRKELVVVQSIRLSTGANSSISLEVAAFYRVGS